MTGRRAVAAMLVSVAVLASTLSVTLFLVLRAVADPSATHAAAGEIFTSKKVRDKLQGNVADALATQPTLAVLPPETLAAIEAQVVADPEFADAFADTIANAQSHIIEGDQAPTSFDVTGPVQRAVLAQPGATPELVQSLTPGALSVTLSGGTLPDLSEPVRLLRVLGRFALIVAFGAWILAFVLAPDRYRPLRSFARLLITVGVVFLAWAWVAPWLCQRYGGAWGAVPAAVIRAWSGPLAGLGIAVLVAGVIATLVARALRAVRPPAGPLR